jgi:hypothetical protein
VPSWQKGQKGQSQDAKKRAVVLRRAWRTMSRSWRVRAAPKDFSASGGFTADGLSRCFGAQPGPGRSLKKVEGEDEIPVSSQGIELFMGRI